MLPQTFLLIQDPQTLQKHRQILARHLARGYLHYVAGRSSRAAGPLVQEFPDSRDLKSDGVPEGCQIKLIGNYPLAMTRFSQLTAA